VRTVVGLIVILAAFIGASWMFEPEAPSLVAYDGPAEDDWWRTEAPVSDFDPWPSYSYPVMGYPVAMPAGSEGWKGSDGWIMQWSPQCP
jgi:hypothetical protein